MNIRLLTSLAALAALLAGTPIPGDTQTALPHVRVAALAIDVGALSYYATQQGFFKKHGLDVEIVTGTNGGAIAAAVVGGSIDIGDGNSTSIATGHERGIPFVMVAPSGAYSSKAPTGAMLVAKASTFKTAKDLVGKTVGISGLRNISEVATRAWLDKNGVANDSVKFVEIPFSTMSAALASGRVDAVMAEEPVMSSMLADGTARLFAKVYEAIAPEWIEGGYFCTIDYAKAHPDIIRKFVDAMSEAAVWANANHPATAVMLAEYSKMPLSPNVQRMYYPPHLNAADLQPLIDASAKYGILKASFPAKDLIAPGVSSE